MTDEFDPEMALLVRAADLRLAAESSGDLLEGLAERLALALPQHTTVTRGGWFLARQKPVTALEVVLGEHEFKLMRSRGGHFEATVAKRVRGVVLKTEPVELEAWSEALATALNRIAASNEQARSALGKLTGR